MNVHKTTQICIKFVNMTSKYVKITMPVVSSKSDACFNNPKSPDTFVACKFPTRHVLLGYFGHLHSHSKMPACTLIQSQYLSHKHPHTPLQAHPPPFASDTSQVGLLSDGESGLKEPVGFKRKTVSKEKQKSGRASA